MGTVATNGCTVGSSAALQANAARTWTYLRTGRARAGPSKAEVAIRTAGVPAGLRSRTAAACYADLSWRTASAATRHSVRIIGDALSVAEYRAGRAARAGCLGSCHLAQAKEPTQGRGHCDLQSSWARHRSRQSFGQRIEAIRLHFLSLSRMSIAPRRSDRLDQPIQSKQAGTTYRARHSFILVAGKASHICTIHALCNFCYSSPDIPP
jgi:hypothetical protein